MKCYGYFVCSKCCTISHKSFEIEKEEDVKDLSITCPTCGKEVETTIPSDMMVVIRTLSNKGYHITNIIPNTLGVSFYPKVENITPDMIPEEFAYDTTEKDQDIIVNDRMRANDFEGLNEAEYRNEAKMRLLTFARNLPQIGMGMEVDLDNPKVDMFDDMEEE